MTIKVEGITFVSRYATMQIAKNMFVIVKGFTILLVFNKNVVVVDDDYNFTQFFKKQPNSQEPFHC